MRQRSGSREREWKSFKRALARMGRLLQRQKAPEGGYGPKREQRHPLLELIMGAPAVVSAIGDVSASDAEEKGVLTWASVSEASHGTTLRLNHKGTRERCEEALRAALDAIRRIGWRIPYHDMIRHENQNGYLMLIKVRGVPVQELGFAR